MEMHLWKFNDFSILDTRIFDVIIELHLIIISKKCILIPATGYIQSYLNMHFSIQIDCPIVWYNLVTSNRIPILKGLEPMHLDFLLLMKELCAIKTEFEVSGNQSRLYSAYSALHDAITIGSEKISSPLTILMCIDR